MKSHFLPDSESSPKPNPSLIVAEGDQKSEKGVVSGDCVNGAYLLLCHGAYTVGTEKLLVGSQRAIL